MTSQTLVKINNSKSSEGIKFEKYWKKIKKKELSSNLKEFRNLILLMTN